MENHDFLMKMGPKNNIIFQKCQKKKKKKKKMGKGGLKVGR